MKLVYFEKKMKVNYSNLLGLKRLRQLASGLLKDKAVFQDYDNIIRKQECAGLVEQINLVVIFFPIMVLSGEIK